MFVKAVANSRSVADLQSCTGGYWGLGVLGLWLAEVEVLRDLPLSGR